MVNDLALCARGAVAALRVPRLGRGITPACAGSRRWPACSCSMSRDHPRVRGEQCTAGQAWPRLSGSPPRARGADLPLDRGDRLAGITPACAGSRRTATSPPLWRGEHPRVRGEQVGRCVDHAPSRGSPPRARGAGHRRRHVHRAGRITPACAGSSRLRLAGEAPRQDHPRVRGEQVVDVNVNGGTIGSPPRAWGAGAGAHGRRARPGITPACAGSRAPSGRASASGRDHPRVRGEQGTAEGGPGVPGGSPPRARGAGQGDVPADHRHGITPACAGSRPSPPTRRTPVADHPRVRGEQSSTRRAIQSYMGSPPRARGAVRRPVRGAGGGGITPACAGSSPGCATPPRRASDHPRVRGEQFLVLSALAGIAGSPPRARGAGHLQGASRSGHGITPACAGSRPDHQGGLIMFEDHPRVRGEQIRRGFQRLPWTGSPPRARGAGRGELGPRVQGGITPACAGSSCTCSPRPTRRSDHPRVRGEQVREPGRCRCGRGSPPRARGAERRPLARAGRVRITPACAGSSSPSLWSRTRSRDHPRVRGEQGARAPYMPWLDGSPPRARGAERRLVAPVPHPRITPACAGSRRPWAGSSCAWRDHPRVRGEQTSIGVAGGVVGGSPPRARGAGVRRDRARELEGITPACAGSRCHRPGCPPTPRDHPRVRGEQVF